ncbi:MAG TPA: NifB/NifX family molybdenum-iron cluster-binding protein [bacterium]|nr:NifB/NifX family molybdenum-iron cluster-binding protein [bacterium]
MKIAMPTDDRKTLAAHFGRAAEFAVYETAGADAKLLEFRPNVHAHAAGPHGQGQGQGAGQGAGAGRDFEQGLAGVETLICRGMGRRAEEACAAMGTRVVFTNENDLDDTAKKFARGELAEGEASCDRGEGHNP